MAVNVLNDQTEFFKILNFFIIIYVILINQFNSRDKLKKSSKSHTQIEISILHCCGMP